MFSPPHAALKQNQSSPALSPQLARAENLLVDAQVVVDHARGGEALDRHRPARRPVQSCRAPTTATASAGVETRKPVNPGSTTSLIEPRSNAITGVPHIIDSTTDRPNGSAKATGCSSAAALAENLRAPARPDRTEVRHPVTVDPRLDALPEVRLVVDDPANHEPAACSSGDFDRGRGSLVGMDAAERDERVAARRGERQFRAVDAVVDVGGVVQTRSAVCDRDRNER